MVFLWTRIRRRKRRRWRWKRRRRRLRIRMRTRIRRRKRSRRRRRRMPRTTTSTSIIAKTCDDKAGHDDNKDDKDTSAYMICGLKLCFVAGFGRYRFA